MIHIDIINRAEIPPAHYRVLYRPETDVEIDELREIYGYDIATEGLPSIEFCTLEDAFNEVARDSSAYQIVNLDTGEVMPASGCKAVN